MNHRLTTLPDIGKAFKTMQAIQGEDKRREEAIEELKRGFLADAKSYWMAEKLAEERYLLINKHQKHG